MATVRPLRPLRGRAPRAGLGGPGVQAAHRPGQGQRLRVSRRRSPTPHPLRRGLSRLRLKEPGASWLLASHPREKCLFLPFCSSAFTSPSRRRAELVWCTRTPLGEAPLTPPPLGHSAQLFIPQIFMEHCWGSQSHPDAESDLAELLTLKLGFRSGSGGLPG